MIYLENKKNNSKLIYLHLVRTKLLEKYRSVISLKELLENMKINCECGICGHTIDQECIINDCDCCVNFHKHSG